MLKHACLIRKCGWGQGTGTQITVPVHQTHSVFDQEKSTSQAASQHRCPAGMHGKKSDSKLVAASLDLELPE